MSETKRVAMLLTVEAAEALTKLTTPRKQGEYLSRLILEAAASKGQAAPPQYGILEQMASQLERIEKRLNSF